MLRRISSTRRLSFDPGSDHVGFVVHKAALGQVYLEYFGSLPNHSTGCPTLIIYHPEQV
jgi:hypothetical protein